MNFLRLSILGVMLLLSACSGASSGPSKVTVRDAWVRPAIPDQVSGAYMVIENAGGADRLVEITTDAAGAAEVHETKSDGGMTSMQPVQGGLEIPENWKVELRPGSYHVMLMNLKRELKPGDKVTFTLKLQSGTQLTVDAEVRSN